jgi:hypothetical protein
MAPISFISFQFKGEITAKHGEVLHRQFETKTEKKGAKYIKNRKKVHEYLFSLPY